LRKCACGACALTPVDAKHSPGRRDLIDDDRIDIPATIVAYRIVSSQQDF
jgi:hypothetical protein